jgi:hypothetical protein
VAGERAQMKHDVVVAGALGVVALMLGGLLYAVVASNAPPEADLQPLPPLQSRTQPPQRPSPPQAPPPQQLPQQQPPSPFAAFGPDSQIAPVKPDQLFLAAAVNRGDTLANVQLADPNGRTTIVRVVVESGATPIAVLLQADDAVIWDFEGAVDRIARAMVVPAYGNRAAVRGLPAANVEFLNLTRCPLQRMPIGDGVDRRADETFQHYFGRAPQHLGIQQAPNAVVLPAVTFGVPPTTGPERTPETSAEKDLLSYHPGGFRVVDAGSLVARGDVLTPDTYPGEAGLIQLERSGAIRRATPAEIDAFSDGLSTRYRSKISPDFRMRPGFNYAVTRDVSLPAGLQGSHARNFLVLSGVPAPRGNAGHGCLAFMDGFRTRDDGLSCYGSEGGDGIRRLARLPDPAPAERCRRMTVAPDASIEAVSMYEPKTAKHSFNSPRIAQPVDVRVSRSGAVVLVLNTYEPAIWRVSAAPGTQIAGVILIGYYTSRVEGIASDTPVVSLDYEGRNNQPAPDPVCAPFSTYLGTAFRGGPAAMVLDRQIVALTGKSVDGLRGDYALANVEIR